MRRLLSLPVQILSNSGLNRSLPAKDAAFFGPALESGRALLVFERSVASCQPHPTLAWVPLVELTPETWGFQVAAPVGTAAASTAAAAASAAPVADAYLLGKELAVAAAAGAAAGAPDEAGNSGGGGSSGGGNPGTVGRCVFAVDLTDVATEGSAAAAAMAHRGLSFQPTRAFMLAGRNQGDADAAATAAAGAAAALAGQAAALVGWHRKARFCGSCGSPTAPIEAGLKRKCTLAACGARHYPRTDPCVNVLVESPDGECVLLGRRKDLGLLWSNLAGFVEQSESCEETAAREVFEESGIRLAQVACVGSQPWPTGRASSCELMVGVVARAATGAIQVNQSELADAKWFGRAAVAEALLRSREAPAAEQLTAYLQGTEGAGSGNGSGGGGTGSPCSGGGGAEEVPLCVPGPYAIAHHLLDLWVREGPLFEAEEAAIVAAAAPLAAVPAPSL